MIPSKYQLKETPGSDYLQRTEWNVRDADGTVIFTVEKVIIGGSKATEEFARKHGKPVLHLSADSASVEAARLLKEFIKRNAIRVLNVAGSRASEEPGVYDFVRQVLLHAFSADAPT